MPIPACLTPILINAHVSTAKSRSPILVHFHFETLFPPSHIFTLLLDTLSPLSLPLGEGDSLRWARICRPTEEVLVATRDGFGESRLVPPVIRARARAGSRLDPESVARHRCVTSVADIMIS